MMNGWNDLRVSRLAFAAMIERVYATKLELNAFFELAHAQSMETKLPAHGLV